MLELLGRRPRRRSPPTTTPASAARRGSSATTGGPLAERARRDGVPGDPAAGRLPAARRGRLLARRRARGGRALRRRAVAARRDRGRRRARREARRASGARTAPRTARRRRSRARLHGTVPVIAGAELAAAAAYRWKCQINENADLPAFASALPELDHNEIVGWAAARELGALLGRLPRGPGRAPAQPAAHRADRRAGGGRRRRRRARDRARRDADRAARLARPARRPRLALPRGPARRGPGRRSRRSTRSRPRWPSGDRSRPVHGGIVRTMDPARPVARSLVVEGDRIVALDEDPAGRSSGSTCDGGCVLPGFTDAHVHFPTWARHPPRAAAARHARRRCSRAWPRRCRRVPPGRWLRGFGWTDFEPSLAALDAVTGDVPVALLAHDWHSLWVNSAALAHASGDLERPGRRGRPARPGVLREESAWSFRDRFALPTARGARGRARARRCRWPPPAA